jgi:hypothetical protein
MRRTRWPAAALVLITMTLATAWPAGASESRGRLYAAFDAGAGRPGLAAPASADARPELRLASTDGGAMESSAGPSPFVAGLLSAIVPGTGQLVMGQTRGWIYLGVEGAAWFSNWALRDAGNQSEEDYKEFADGHWAWDRYESESDCGEGLGPIDYENERAALLDAFQNSRDDFYDDIGGLDVYACGWDAQNNRSRYEGMRDDADTLFRSARYAVTVAFLNHLVSAIDAAKSASNRRKAREREMSWDWSVQPTPRGDVAVRVELSRRF